MFRSPISVHQTFNQERKPNSCSVKDASSHGNQGVVILKVPFNTFFVVTRVPLDVAGNKEHQNER